VRIADFFIGFAGAFSSRFFNRFDQACVSRKVLDPREPVDIFDFIKQHQRKDWSDARDGA
jgi:hypothetical protein